MSHPDRVGPYRIEAPVGKGGMASVYRAVHETEGTVVALKVFAPDFTETDEYFLRAQREVVALSMCAHPNIPRIIGHEVRAEGGYVAIEFIDGDNLEDLIAQTGPLEIPIVLRAARDVGGALGYCHVRGMFHRDLKPANIVLERSTGRAVLLDFGIVKAVNLTNISVVGQRTMGTLTYMAPEQFAGRPADGRTDLYQLGLVLWQLVTGLVPPPVVELMEQKEPGVPDKLLDPLTEHLHRLPGGFETLLRNAVHLDPETRYATALELLRDLATVERGESIPERNQRFKTPAEARRAIRKALSPPRADGAPEGEESDTPVSGMRRTRKVSSPAVAVEPVRAAPAQPRPALTVVPPEPALPAWLTWTQRLLPLLVAAVVLAFLTLR